MKRKIKLFFLMSLTALLLLVSFIGIKYYSIVNSDKIPVSNVKVFGTGNCYIYLNIKNQDRTFPIVIENTSLNYYLKQNKWLPYPLYIYKIGNIIKDQSYLVVNDKLFSELKDWEVDANLIKKYNSKNILRDSSLIINNHIKKGLNWENQKAIIYNLLKIGINCCSSCDGGGVVIVFSPRSA